MTMTHRNSGVVNIINNGKVKWNGHFAGRKEHETPYPRADSTGKHSNLIRSRTFWLCRNKTKHCCQSCASCLAQIQWIIPRWKCEMHLITSPFLACVPASSSSNERWQGRVDVSYKHMTFSMGHNMQRLPNSQKPMSVVECDYFHNL